jgi:1-phosphofructokinase family hexose kinase
MILTLTLNPAIDVSLQTDRIIYDDRTYITAETAQPGGKGINAARTIHGYGADVRSISTFGGEIGRRFEQLVAESEVPVQLISVAGETRRNVAITDDEGLTIKLDQIGSPISAEDLAKVDASLLEHLPQADWLMLNGSLPPGVPADYYARAIAAAHERGVETLLDTSGEALALGLAARPSIAKPNRAEAERLLNRTLFSEAHALEAAEDVLKLGAKRVILSLGAQGAVAVSEEGRWRATPPGVQTGSPIGAGDVLAATCVWALSEGRDFPKAFAWGVAAATVAAGRPGLGAGTLDDVRKMRERIALKQL